MNFFNKPNNFNNTVSAAYYATGDWELATVDARVSVLLDPKYTKGQGLVRRWPIAGTITIVGEKLVACA